MKKQTTVILTALLLFSLTVCQAQIEPPAKSYLKTFEADGTTLKIPSINIADSVVSYQETKDFFQFNITKNRYDGVYEYSFPLETQGLRFVYQRPLNEELNPKNYAFVNATHALNLKGEVMEHRPENVVGSYAVYKENVESGETGKLYHIYRPLLVDAEKKTSWADLTVTKTELTITCDPEFLKSAAYPVVIDPSFGYTTIGASTSTLDNNVDGSQFTCSESGTGDSITVALEEVGGNWEGKVKCAVYLASDLSAPITNGETEERTIALTGSFVWYTFDFPVSPSFTAETDYCLYAWAEDVSAYNYIARDDDAGVNRWYESHIYTGSFPALSASDRTGKFSIYANYTTGAVSEESVSLVLSTPANESTLDSYACNFSYTPMLVGSDDFHNATLYLNGTASAYNQTAVENATLNVISYVLPGENASYLWDVQVYNSTHGLFSSNGNFSVVIAVSGSAVDSEELEAEWLALGLLACVVVGVVSLLLVARKRES